MKKVISAIMSIAILAIPLTASAADIEQNVLSKDKEIQVSVLDTGAFVKNSFEGKSVMKTIGAGDLTRLKKKINGDSLGNQKSKEKMAVDVFKSLGNKISNNSQEVAKFVSYFDSAKEIFTKEEYKSIDPNGNSKVLTKDEIMAEIHKNELQKQIEVPSKLRSTHTDSLTDQWGFLRQTLTAIYLGESAYTSKNGTTEIVPKYYVSATNEWLKKPANLLRDAFSIVSLDSPLVVSAYSTDYSSYGYADVLTFTGKQEMESTLNPTMNPGGLSCSWYLTPYLDGTGYSYYNLSCNLSGIFVMNTPNKSPYLIRLWTKYEHAKIGVALSIGWDLGSKIPGVSIGPAITKTTDGFSMEFWTSGDYK